MPRYIYTFIFALVLAVFSVTVSAPVSYADEESATKRGKLHLLAPLNDKTGADAEVDLTQGPLGAWQDYFAMSAEWLYRLAVGFCVLWMLIGGFHLMVSGDNQSLRQQGVEKMTSALIGLILLIFAPAILKFLNASFFE